MYLLYKYTIEHYDNVVNTPFLFFRKQYLEIKRDCRKQNFVSGSPGLYTQGYSAWYLLFLFIFIVRKRQAEDKFGSHTFGTDNVDILIVGLNNFSGNGQAQAGSFFVLAS